MTRSRRRMRPIVLSALLGCGRGRILGARVSRPADAAFRRSRAYHPVDDPSPTQAGLETRAPRP